MIRLVLTSGGHWLVDDGTDVHVVRLSRSRFWAACASLYAARTHPDAAAERTNYVRDVRESAPPVAERWRLLGLAAAIECNAGCTDACRERIEFIAEQLVRRYLGCLWIDRAEARARAAARYAEIRARQQHRSPFGFASPRAAGSVSITTNREEVPHG